MIRTALLGAAAVLATAATAQVPPDVAAKLAAMGRVIDPPGTGALYAPLQKRMPIAGVMVRRDVAYGPDPKATFDVFTSASSSGAKRPILIFVHGGGFRIDDKRGFGPDSPFYDNVMLWAVSHGLTGINFNYPLAPGAVYPSAQHGLATVVAWARAHAAEIGGDPNRVILLGHSAGASHVASYVAHPESYQDVVGARQPVAGVALLSGTYDMAGATADNVYFGKAAGLAELSAAKGLVAANIPLFLATAELDPTGMINQSETLAAMLTGAGHRYTLASAKQHSHMSEIYAINSGDESIAAPLLQFITSVPPSKAMR